MYRFINCQNYIMFPFVVYLSCGPRRVAVFRHRMICYVFLFVFNHRSSTLIENIKMIINGMLIDTAKYNTNLVITAPLSLHQLHIKLAVSLPTHYDTVMYYVLSVKRQNEKFSPTLGFEPTTFHLLGRRDIHCATDMI